MNSGKKVIVNSAALFAKNIINIIISLWSVPLILKALGESDYGLYSLIAGVVAMFGFLSASMTVSTQRYMSVTMGKKDVKELNIVYNTSKVLHLIQGFLLVIVLELCGVFLFNGTLNISPERVNVAKITYQAIIVSTFLINIIVPYNAIINAYEDLFAYSIFGIVDSILKLFLSFSLYVISWDKLIWYAVGIAFINLFCVIISRLYVFFKYSELSNNIFQSYDSKLMVEMFKFAGWNALGSLAMIGRNQGIAVVLNYFFCTVANAAYGIANQISGAASTFSAVLQQAINPQLMKSEGAGNRDRMLRISYTSSKLSILIVAIIAIPLFAELPFILQIWLGDYPKNTLELSRLILIFALVYQCSMGIMSAVQSRGRIGSYQIAMSILILSNIPLSICFLWLEFPVYSVIVGFIIIEIVTLGTRLWFAHRLVDFNVSFFLSNVILKCVPPMILSCFSIYLVSIIMPQGFDRLITTIVVNIITFLVFTWLFTLNKEEKIIMKNISKRINI